MALIQSGATSDLLTIDPISKAARASLYDTSGNPIFGTSGENLPTTPYGLINAGVNDGAFRLTRVDRFGNVRTGQEVMLFRDCAETVAVSGTPISPNLNQWATAVSGFAVGAPTSNGNQLTSTTSVTTNAYSIATTLRQFPKNLKAPLFYRQRTRIVSFTNSICEFGFGAPTTNTAIVPDGAFWRYTSGGMVVPVIAFNGAEITGADVSTGLVSTNYYTWEVIVDDDSTLFVCQDVTTGRSISEQTLRYGAGQTKAWSKTHLPVFNRTWNSGVPATGPTFLFSDTYVCALDNVQNRNWNDQVVGATNGGTEVYPGAYAAASAQTANIVNSTAPASCTLSNTAAGYTTLGGQFQFAAVAGAETEYAIFGFTVPVGFTLWTTGIHINTFNMGAVVATTPTLMQWAIANNSSAVSLATVGLTKTILGTQSFPVGQPIGLDSQAIDLPFTTSIRTDGGRIFHVILKMPVATATASQIIRGTVMVRGFFE